MGRPAVGRGEEGTVVRVPNRSRALLLAQALSRIGVAAALLALVTLARGVQEVETPALAPQATSSDKAHPEPPEARLVSRESLPEAFRIAVPKDLAQLKAIEERVTKLVARVSPALVGVRIAGSSGSGVVISEDGLVLGAAHVSGEPDRNVRFLFPDGTSARGKTLGTDHREDAGLMKITSDGSWPHVDVGRVEDLRAGDWVLALGHPGGFDAKRSIVVRLGRIIRLGSGMIQTDCTLTSGDSGGPLFDMHGRVVGIHSRISESTSSNFHVPIRAYSAGWDRLVRSENWGQRDSPPQAYIGVRIVDHPDGCMLDGVDEEGPASKAGLKEGDVLTRFDGRPIEGSAGLVRYVARSRPGQEVTLLVKREDREVEIKVTLEAPKRTEP